VTHKRTEGQFESTWKELQQALPKNSDTGFLLGVSDNKLLLDGVPLEAGQAERSFAQLLNAAGLSSIMFSSKVTLEDFTRLVRAFALGGSKAQDFARQIKETLGDNKDSSIRINEVKFVAADPATGEIPLAAQLAAQALGPEFKEWLNDPQKLLQLIAAAQGASNGGVGGAALGSVPSVPIPGGSAAAPQAAVQATGQQWAGGVVPLQEEEVIQTIRLLTHFGQALQDPNSTPENLKVELGNVSDNTKVNLAQLLESLAAQASQNTSADGNDTPLLMKAAESMAIKFALDRYQRGDVKVNAVHEMMEHMSRQMDTLRQILRVQEDKLSKAGVLVESHADILDRMFWAEIPEAGKKSVLLSTEIVCVPPRNIRQFVELLFERDDSEIAAKILTNYSTGLDAQDADPRRKTAIGLSQLADLYASAPDEVMTNTLAMIGERLRRENDTEIQSLLSAAFTRFGQEAGTRRKYKTIFELCDSLERMQHERPALVQDLRSRVGIENRLPEMIEEAIGADQVSEDLVNVLQQLPKNSVEHLADRFFRARRRVECDRIVELVADLGQPAIEDLRATLHSGQPRQAAAVVGLLSRLDVPSLLELLPTRLPEWNRFYHDVVVRQVAYGAAHDRGRSRPHRGRVVRRGPGPRVPAPRRADAGFGSRGGRRGA